jgi:hypothetical protein
MVLKQLQFNSLAHRLRTPGLKAGPLPDNAIEEIAWSEYKRYKLQQASLLRPLASA